MTVRHRHPQHTTLIALVFAAVSLAGCTATRGGQTAEHGPIIRPTYPSHATDRTALGALADDAGARNE